MIRDISICLLSSVRSDDPDVGTLGCATVVIRIDAQTFERLSSRVQAFREAARQDDQLYECYYWDAATEYYAFSAWEDLSDALSREVFDNDRVVPIPCDRVPDDELQQRAECRQLVLRRVAGSDVVQLLWGAYPKHADVWLLSDPLPFEELERLFEGDKHVG